MGQRVNFGEFTGKKMGSGGGGLLGYSYGVNKASGGKLWDGCLRRGETESGLV